MVIVLSLLLFSSNLRLKNIFCMNCFKYAEGANWSDLDMDEVLITLQDAEQFIDEITLIFPDKN